MDIPNSCEQLLLWLETQQRLNTANARVQLCNLLLSQIVDHVFGWRHTWIAQVKGHAGREGREEQMRKDVFPLFRIGIQRGSLELGHGRRLSPQNPRQRLHLQRIRPCRTESSH